MSITSDIYEAFFTVINGAGLGIGVAYPGVDYTGGLPYVEINPLPAGTIPTDIVSGDMHYGLMQFSLTYAAGDGIITATKKADEILALFPRNTMLTEGTTDVNIETTGWHSPPITDRDRIMIPVSVPYQYITRS